MIAPISKQIMLGFEAGAFSAQSISLILSVISWNNIHFALLYIGCILQQVDRKKIIFQPYKRSLCY